MSLKIFFTTICVLFASCKPAPEKVIEYVDPFIGTGEHGHTFPGATLPHGLVQLSPDTRLRGWDACGGYHYDDQSLLGFSHTHISGTGIGDYGDILFLPFTEELKKVVRNGDDQVVRFGSRFSHESEGASPGYYKVTLDDYGVMAELTATPRTGIHRYTFPASSQSGLMIDLTTSIHERKCLMAKIKVISDTEISGMKHVEGWAPDRHVYFHAQFSKPFTALLEVEGKNESSVNEVASQNIRAILQFGNTKQKEQIVAKVGISFVDEAGARMNLEKEAPRWDFDLYRRGAEERWEEELSRIEVTSADETAKTIFYTGLYHTMISPTVSSDIEGEQASPDITGMMGQYAHGNEPSHQTAHIYNLIGQPWKTQELVDEILCRLYLATPDGISGNEDCGQMSAWYVLNSMGFFSYCPGIPEYSIGRPLFNEVKIRLQNGKQFAIKATDNSRNNKYVQSATLNGKILSSPFFSHQELLNGGVLELQMDSIPNVRWGSRD